MGGGRKEEVKNSKRKTERQKDIERDR